MYGLLGYSHFMASTQIRLDHEAEAATDAKPVVPPAMRVWVLPRRVHAGWVWAAALYGAFGLANGFAWVVGL